ncbi:DUF3267 domain-containing protein [Clostridium oceanicum]|uniref:DUF3267 domain-containing protein n=1 Tax=Clostridium oceanicum TaxID=1543 RepID=A0ABP3UM58_9CLOT
MLRKKKLSKFKGKRIDQFNRISEGLINRGYKEKLLTVTTLKANVMAILIFLPIYMICCLLFHMIYKDNYSYPMLNSVFWIVVVIGIVVHEFIHGITWGYSCKKGYKAISFGFELSTLTPYCCCSEAMPFKNYALGCAMPTIILGIIPYIIGLILGNYYYAMFGGLHILCGGGDMYVLWLIRKNYNSIIVDHPYLVGCVAFEK